MTSKATTPEEYIASLPEDRKAIITDIYNTFKNNLPKGFKATMGYGMIAFVVPHSVYPKGYHCDPKLPLGLINIASQKNYIAVHHMGLYTSNPLLAYLRILFTVSTNEVV